MDSTKINRLLALLKAKAEYTDRKLDFEVPEGFKESFENQKGFRGWINYHETWDVNPDDAWVVIVRTQSLTAEWHRQLVKVVPVITSDGTIVSAAEWEKHNKPNPVEGRTLN